MDRAIAARRLARDARGSPDIMRVTQAPGRARRRIAHAAHPRCGTFHVPRSQHGDAHMIGYVTLGTNDLPRAAAFYDALMAEIGAKRLYDFGRGIAWGVS